MNDKSPSPRVTDLAWGRLSVESNPVPFRDAKLYPGGSRAWDWNETGTRHFPGIQPADVEELLEHGAKTVILSRGVLLRLKVCASTLELLKNHDVAVHVLQTNKAVKLYNRLAAIEPVGALIHSTC